MNRQQWMGVEGAPKTLGFTARTKWGKQKGLGVIGLMDEAGPMKTMQIGADFAYEIQLSKTWNLTGGIRAGLGNMALNFTGIRVPQAGDEAFLSDRSTGLQVNTGWGLHLEHEKGTFVTISQPRMFRYDFGAAGVAFKDNPTFFTMLGTNWVLSDHVVLRPSALIRFTADVPLSYDVNVVASINKRLDAGLSYRKSDSVGFRLGIQATTGIYIGYVYELPISSISQMSNQTHELALRFAFKKHQSPQ